jgi:Peptidase family S41
MEKSKSSAKNRKTMPRSAAVSGAVPYQPKMSKAETRSAVEDQIGQRIRLADYRSTVTPLTQAEREVLIEQALEILERLYAHLPLKRALHANDPVQALRLLRLRHPALDERAFHSALRDVFLGLRDLHTNYMLPAGYGQKIAFLPFRVEEFYEPGGVAPADPVRKYAVSWVSPVNTTASLKEGVIVTHWNGSPIDLAVARNGSKEAGSNADARRAQGIEALTLRWLGMSLPPDEDWVTLTYTDGVRTYDARLDWEVIDLGDRRFLLAGLEDGHVVNVAQGLDLNRVVLDRARKLIFDPQAAAVEREATAAVAAAGITAAEPPRAQTSRFPDVFERFGPVTVAGVGTFGYIRLRSFAPQAWQLIDQVVGEFARILATLPPTGLILDVRGNGGGFINIGERILQMLTPQEIVPEPFHFLATPLTQAIAKAGNNWGEWEETIRQGIESGASFSQGFPLTEPRACNDIGQVYQGPVLLVTDALCYSTTDIFAAGFQDHRVGVVFGCHASTGAGGATVWDHKGYLETLGLAPSNPFLPLPKGAGMRVAALRCTRVGARAGMPVEDYGVATEVRYYMTKADVVGHNEDLIAAAARLLNKLPKQELRLTSVAGAPHQQYTVNCANIDRVDVALDGRPIISENVTAPSFTLSLPAPAKAGSVLQAKGYLQGELVVSTRLQV